MGLGLTGAGYPYRLLFDYAPGWNGVRVPGRIFTLATLFYALLAGAGVQLRCVARCVVRRLSGAGRPRSRGAARARGRAATDRDPRRRRRAPRAPRSCPSRRERRSACPGRCSTCRPTARSTACGSTSRPTASTRSRSATAPSTCPRWTTCAAACTDSPIVRASRSSATTGSARSCCTPRSPKELPPEHGYVDRRAAEPRRRRRQADRRPRHHAQARRVGRDLLDRPRPEGHCMEPAAEPRAAPRPAAHARRRLALALGDPARRARLRGDDPELLLESDLPLRPHARDQRRPDDDRPLPVEHGRQGLLQAVTGTPRARPAWRCSRFPSTTRST